MLLLKGAKSDFVRRHATESLNFQISLLIYSVVAVLALGPMLLTQGLNILVPVILVIAIVALGLIVVAGVAANRGDDFRYPVTIRIVR